MTGRMLARLVTADGCSKIVTVAAPPPPAYISPIARRPLAVVSFAEAAKEPYIIERRYEFWGYDEAWDGVDTRPCALYREAVK